MTAPEAAPILGDMRERMFVLALLAVASAACAQQEHKAAPAARPNWLIDVPYIAQSILEDTTGTPDAQHIVILSPGPIDSVAAFYRTRLPPMGWQVVSDMSDSVRVNMYLQRRGLPMWILMEAQGPQTRVSFTATGRGTPPQPVSGR